MSDKNAHVIGEPSATWPVPPEYISPWTFASLAERVNAIAPDECCRGLVDLLLTVAREADQKLSKALLDVWTLEGLLKNGNEADR